MSANDRLTLMAIFAHPDDESFGTGGTLARYGADPEVRVVLVCATRGEAGEISDPKLATHERLGEVREYELLCACQNLGVEAVHFLGYRDSGMPGEPANDHSASFHRAEFDEAVGRLVAVMRRARPQVVITYGDDQQGYPHPDHLKVHDITVPAFWRSGDPGWYPEAGEPWQPSKLYYSVWSRARLEAIHNAMLALKGQSPFDEKWFERPSQDHRITTRVDVRDHVWARTHALLAHATQIDPGEPFWFGLSDDELAAAYPWEDWVLAESLVGRPAEGELEDDLFAGVRQRVAP